jgi:pyruvate dehydrogenase phosphatase
LAVISGLSKELIARGRLENGLKSTIPLAVALSGCVACVAHIEGPHVHVANTGDCSAYLAVEYSSAQGMRWIPRKLTRDHTCDNAAEVQRIYCEHPESERESVLRNERLLGELMPLRAFGDFRWA